MARNSLAEAPPPVDSSSIEGDEDDTHGDDNGAVGDHQRNDDVEQDGSEEEEDEEDEEEDEENGQVSFVPKPTVTERSETPTNSISGSDSDSDSDMPSPSASAFTIKPIVSNPNKSAPKRPAEPDPALAESPASKRKKNKASEEEEEAKRGSGFQRLWSEDDEIAILSGMTRFQAERGADPYTDMSAFHDFLKKSLHVDVSKNQLMDKIRRLKKKYKNNIEKCEHGQEPVFSKPHDVKSFELSKKVWGNNGGNVEKVKPSGGGGLTLALPSQGQELAGTRAPTARKQKKAASNRGVESGEIDARSEEVAITNKQNKVSNGATDGGEGGAKSLEVGAKGEGSVSEECLSELLGLEGLSEETIVFMTNNVGLVEDGKLKELKIEWKRLRKLEVELFLKRMDLVGRMGKLVMDAVNSL